MNIKSLFDGIQDRLRQAVKERSWTLVEQVLRDVGGDDDFVASPPAYRDEIPARQNKENFLSTVKKEVPTAARKSGKNKFSPDDYKDYTNDLEKHINDNVARTPRRTPYTPLTVTCLSCSKTMQVNPALVSDRSSYTCDRCISKRVS